jgi:hypothetical protein
MADHVQNRVRFRGLWPGHACVAEPGTSAVTERLFRTFKEQVVHGRVVRTIDEVRKTIRAFAARTNAKWLIEKNGYRSPPDARAAPLDTDLSRAA